MSITFEHGLRFKLMLLVLLALLPSVGMILYSGQENKQSARREAQALALGLAKKAALMHDDVISNAHEMLFTLAQTPQVKERHPEACSVLLSRLLKGTEGYSDLLTALPDGSIFASGRALDKTPNFADRPWFKKLLQTKSFTVSEYLIGRISGKAIIVMAHPVTDEVGQLVAVLIAGLDLEWLNKYIAGFDLPREETLTVIDRKGTILGRFPDAEKFTGRIMPEAALVKTVLARKEGVTETVGLDGLSRLYGFTPLIQGTDEVIITVGIPSQTALARVERQTSFNLTLLILVTLLAMFTALFIAELTVLRPVDRILNLTRQLAAGDLSVRAGPPYSSGEIGRLAKSIDHMIASFQEKEAERQITLNRLQLSEARFRAIFESTSDSIMVWDREYNLLFVNQAAIDSLGVTRDKLIGSNIRDASSHFPNFINQWVHRIGQVFETGRPLHVEDAAPIAERLIHGESFLSPIRDAHGHIQAVGVVYRDITERKNAEKEGAATKARLEHLLVSSPSVIYSRKASGDMKMVFISPNLKELFGWTAIDFLSDSDFWAKHLHSAERDWVLEEFSQILERGYICYEYRFQRQDETYVWIRDELRVAKNESGQPLEIVGCWSDVTNSREAEQMAFRQLTLVNAINRVFVDSLTRPSVADTARACLSTAEALTDSKWGCIGIINESKQLDLVALSEPGKVTSPWLPEQDQRISCLCQAMRGYWEEIIQHGRSITATIPYTRPALVDAAESYQSNTGILIAPLKNGDEIIGMTAVAGRDEGYNLANQEDLDAFCPAMVIAMNRKRTDEELRRYHEHLEEMVVERTREVAEQTKELTRSNADLEQFAYVASHDLQEPLRIMTSYLQLLEKRYKGQLDEDGEKFIKNAVAAAARMRTLINDLLSYSRVGTRGKPFELTDSESLFQQILGNLRVAIESTGALVTNDPLPTIRADPRQLFQLFQNLVGNAIKFKGDAPGRIHVSAEKREDDWVFSVSDNGIGIGPEYRDKIFGVFQRLHPVSRYSGTGIGLAICKKIVERHGGAIWVESAASQGSVFYFSIPDRGGSSDE